MNRFERTLSEQVATILGDQWTVECPKGFGRLIATHENGSRVLVGMYGEDGRRNATEDDAHAYVSRCCSFLRGEIHKYTPEWADKGREALASMPVAELFA